MNDLQAVVARAADRTGSHSTAPALLLQAAAALGRLAEMTNAATDGGRRPFRIPADWQSGLAELAYLVYLLADQTAVDIDAAVRSTAYQVGAASPARTGAGPGRQPVVRRARLAPAEPLAGEAGLRATGRAPALVPAVVGVGGPPASPAAARSPSSGLSGAGRVGLDRARSAAGWQTVRRRRPGAAGPGSRRPAAGLDQPGVRHPARPALGTRRRAAARDGPPPAPGRPAPVPAGRPPAVPTR